MSVCYNSRDSGNMAAGYVNDRLVLTEFHLPHRVSDTTGIGVEIGGQVSVLKIECTGCVDNILQYLFQHVFDKDNMNYIIFFTYHTPSNCSYNRTFPTNHQLHQWGSLTQPRIQGLPPPPALPSAQHHQPSSPRISSLYLASCETNFTS